MKWHLTRRVLSLYAGLALFGFSVALMVSANLGVDPWDVLHQGLSRRFGPSLGWTVIAVAAIVMLAWIPLRQRPGLGTISNVVVVGLVIDAALGLLPQPEPVLTRSAFLAAGIVTNAVATGLYIGADLGPGPRDGLMTGLARGERSIRLVRTSIEVSVFAAGWLLGGSVGIGTLAYAVCIGPLVQYFMPRLTSIRCPARHSRVRHRQRGLR